MDLKTNKDQNSESSTNETEVAVVTTEYASDLVFRLPKQSRTKFNSVIFTPTLIHQKEKNQKFMVVLVGYQFKLYHIKDHRVSFASAQTINIPFVNTNASSHRITEKSIFLVFWKKYLKENHINREVLLQLGLDPEGDQKVVLEIPIDPRQPEVIQPAVFEEADEKGQGFLIRQILRGSKTILCNELCLLSSWTKRTPQGFFGDPDPKIIYFIGECRKRRRSDHLTRTRRLFQFNLGFDELGFYQAKIISDKASLSSKNVVSMDITLRRLLSSRKNNEHSKKFQVFFEMGPEVITIILIDPRTRKIAARAFVSIYELFRDLRMCQVCNHITLSCKDIEYSPEIDLLVFEANIYTKFGRTSFESIPHEFRKHASLGDSRSTRMAKYYGIEGQDIHETRYARFWIFDVFKKAGGRMVVREGIDFSTTSLIVPQPEGFLGFIETPSQVVFEFLSRNKVQERVYNGSTKNRERSCVRALSEIFREKVKSSVLKIRKGDQFPDSGIKTVDRIDQNTLLVIGSRKFILLDSQTGELLSSCDYSLNQGFFYLKWTFNHDLIIKQETGTLTGERGYLEVFKAETEQAEGSPFRQIGILDLSPFTQLHSVNKIVGLAKLSDEIYEAMIRVEWIESEEVPVLSSHLFCLRFKACLISADRPLLQTIHGGSFCKLNTVSNITRKANQWSVISDILRIHYNFFCRSDPKIMRFNEKGKNLTHPKINFGKFKVKQFGRRTSIAIADGRVYIENILFQSHLKPNIEMLEFGEIVGFNGEVRNLCPIKSREIVSSTGVFFDDVTFVLLSTLIEFF